MQQAWVQPLVNRGRIAPVEPADPAQVTAREPPSRRPLLLLPSIFLSIRVFSNVPDSSFGKESTCNEGDPVQFLGWEDPQEEGMATHSSILAWRIPWREEPGGL